MKLFITEHDENRTMPPLEVQVVPFGEKSKPLWVGTKSIRVQADEYCYIAITVDAPVPGAWWRLVADTPEWFAVTPHSPRPSIWVKAEPEE